jgi:hypothetical protein
VIHAGNARVIDRGRRLRFAHDHLVLLGGGMARGEQALQCDLPSELAVVAQEDAAHAALAQAIDDDLLPDQRAGLQIGELIAIADVRRLAGARRRDVAVRVLIGRRLRVHGSFDDSGMFKVMLRNPSNGGENIWSGTMTG